MDFEALRKEMVEQQLIARGILDKRVLDAFYKVPRHEFIPDDVRKSSYADYPLSIGMGQTISQPYMVAIMTELLGLEGDEKVLEIGTGSGYQAAILSMLCKDVFSIERHEALATKTKETIERLGYRNVFIKIGDGTQGWKENSPFDRIIITAAASKVPEPLLEQLNDPGKLIIPIGSGFSQILTVLDKKNKRIETSQSCGCVFVPLIGKHS